MTIAASPSGLQPEDYEEIEAAVMETARGRWFLAEYARRVRNAESARLLAAIERLEARLEAHNALAPAEAFSVSERLNDLSWSLRERGVEDFVCGKIDSMAREFRGVGTAAQKRARGAEPAVVEPEIVNGPAAEKQVEARAEPSAAASCPCVSIAQTPENEMEAASPPPPVDPRLEALLWLDRLPLVDRMSLFA